MAEIDMIPREYRDGLRVRRALRATGIALAVVAVLGATAHIGLRWRTAALDRQVAALEAAAAQDQADAERGAALQAEQARRRRQSAVLHALRREGELAALAQGLDAALTDQVWLTGLDVERDIQAASPGAAKPADPDGSLEELEELDADGWRLSSAVQLSGQAENYRAVTAFLAALGRQPGVANLKLVGSSAAADGRAVDFRATGTLIRRTTP
jgi:Tfp pilus assembly protein PilN